MECLRAAWESKTSTPLEKLVLVRIADRANDQNSCWPGIASLARECCLSESSIHRAIKGLLNLGLIKVEHGGGLKANTYTFTGFVKTGVSIGQGCLLDTGGVSNSEVGVSIRQGRGVQQTPEGCPLDTQTLIEPTCKPHEPTCIPRRLHGIPSSVDEVIAYGKTIPSPDGPISEARCRAFWQHYEGQARTGPSGDVFWITSGEAIVTKWQLKLISFKEPLGGKGNGNNRQLGQQVINGNTGTLNQPSAEKRAKYDAKARAFVNQSVSDAGQPGVGANAPSRP